MEDLVIWVDENDKELGHVTRKKAHEEGFLHRVVVVMVSDAEGNILVQERMSGKLGNSVSGHVGVGETYLQSARRELFEEVGMNAELTYIGKGMTQEGKHGDGSVRHVYEMFSCVGEPKALSVEEVKSVFWEKPSKLIAEMNNPETSKKYTHTFRHTLQLFLDAKK